MIQTRHDKKRGCGFRKPGGIYLVADGLSRACGKLPIPLDICPTCHQGIHFSRSWTWVDADALAAMKECSQETQAALISNGHLACLACPLGGKMGKAGLLWIGERYYSTPLEWRHEAQQQGISRRIPAVPKDFNLGETWVLVAHRKAIHCAQCEGTGYMVGAEPATEEGDGRAETECALCHGAGKTAGIFHAFKPQAVEYVVKGTETDEEIAALEKRGLTCVRVERDEAPALETEVAQ